MTLLDRLRAPDPLTDVFLQDAVRFFSEQGTRNVARWLELERDGYPESTESQDLPGVLGVEASNALVLAIRNCRLRSGRVVVGSPGRWIDWPHFFVESVPTPRDWRSKLKGWPEVILDFDEAGDTPRSLSYPGTILDDILD